MFLEMPMQIIYNCREESYTLPGGWVVWRGNFFSCKYSASFLFGSCNISEFHMPAKASNLI